MGWRGNRREAVDVFVSRDRLLDTYATDRGLKMRQLRKVLWTKGVLLSPQHLQVQDRFLEDVLGFKISALSFFPWGFSRLELDREALTAGSIAIESAAGLLPDGIAFDMPDADAPPPPRALADDWTGDRTSLDVFLALPERRPGGRNVSLDGAERGTRYVSEILLRRDENTGLAEKPIQVARKSFRLLTDADALEGSTIMPIARVTRASTGEFQLDTQFVPPLLDITASPYLVGIARRLVEILSARSSSLSGARRQRSRGLADFGVSDIANFWLLYTVNTHLPEFRHLLETRHGHPGLLYEAMVGMAGALTTFSTTVQPRMLPEYDHLDLGGCFARLDSMLRDLLDTVVPANHASLPLKLTEPSIHATAIDQDRYMVSTQMYLAVASDIKADELLRKVPQLLKVSSADRIDRLIKRALPGVALSHVANPPSALPIRLDYQYFSLDLSGDDWDAIRTARNLAVYVPSDLPNPRLELIIVFPPARA
jgi:type VI secretion system protein ImpJ